MSAAQQLLKVLKVSLEITKGPLAGQKFDFEKGSISIGRGPENDVIVSQDVKVSRQHLEIQVTSNQVVLRNLSAKNPIAYDGEVVVEKVLRPGASIRFGETEMKVSFDKPIEAKPNLMAVPPVGQSPLANPPQPATPVQNKSVPAPVGTPGSSVPGAFHSQVPTQHQAGFPPHPQASGGGNMAGYAQPARLPPNVSGGGSRLKLYLIVAAILGAAAWLSQSPLVKRKELKLRDAVSTEIAINSSQTEYEKTMKDLEKRGQDTIQFKLSQEQYLRGFRDYRQGQYVRAMEEFQAALSFFPKHDLALKYYTLSKRRFDEQVQRNMIQGKRYYGINNFRLCMAYYSNVIKMKKVESDPIRREAKQYYDECEVKMRGKF